MVKNEKKKVRLPGIEPGSSGWKPDILTTIPKALNKTRTKFKDFFNVEMKINLLNVIIKD